MSTTPPPERGHDEHAHDGPGDERLHAAKRRYDEVADGTGPSGRHTAAAGRRDARRRDDRHGDDRHGDDRHGDGRRGDARPAAAAASVKPRRGFHQWLALLIGLAYLVVGIAGFAVTGLSEPANQEWWTRHDESWMLLVFAVNPLHNAVHLLVGLVGVMLWPSSGGARTYGWLLALAYGAVFLYGLVAQGNEQLDVLHLNWPDNWLHLGSAILGLIIALWPRKKRRADERAYDDARAH